MIRQLSRDLSAKESELILLRKEKFQREHELYRLCTEYGNFTRLEIDQRLNSLQVEENAQKVVSEMIDSAINEKHQKNETKEASSDHSSHPISEIEEKLRPISTKLTPESSKTPELDSELHAKIDKKSWYNWLSPSEEHFPEFATSRFRLLSSSQSRESQPGKAPVELENMVENDQIVVLPDLNIDRHGFYNDTSRPPRKTPDMVKTFELAFAEATILTPKTSRSIETLKHLGELHDAKSEEHVRNWDMFMREIGRESVKNGENDREIFGLKGINLRRSGTSKFFDERNEDSKHYKTFKKLVDSGGIPLKYRNELWFEISGAKNKKIPGEYSRLISISQSSSDPQIRDQIDQVNLDLHRTLPLNLYFNNISTSQPGPHFYKLQNILYAFVAYKPETGYSQGMNKIVGNIILGVSEGNQNGSRRLSEEDVFWTFVSFTEECLPEYGILGYFHKKLLVHIQTDTELVETRYFPKYLPKLHEHFTRLDVHVQVVLLGWWLGVFTDTFASVELWFKLLDSILIAEDCALKFIGYSLSFFKLHEKLLMESKNGEEIYKLMNNLRLSQSNMRFKDLVVANGEFESTMRKEELEKFRNDRNGK